MQAEQQPSAPRFYFDEDVSGQFASALRRRGYDVVTTAEAGQLAKSDLEQLAFAVSQHRVIITHNVRHSPRLHGEWVEAGGAHWGIMIVVGQPSVSELLRRLENILRQLFQDEIEGKLLFLGADQEKLI